MKTNYEPNKETVGENTKNFIHGVLKSVIQIFLLLSGFILWKYVTKFELISILQALIAIVIFVAVKNTSPYLTSIAFREAMNFSDLRAGRLSIASSEFLKELKEEVRSLTVGDVIKDPQRLSFLTYSFIPYDMKVSGQELMEEVSFFIEFIHGKYLECDGEDISNISLLGFRNKMIEDQFSYYHDDPHDKESKIVKASLIYIERLCDFVKEEKAIANEDLDELVF